MILKSVACDGKSHWILSRDRSQTFTYSPDCLAFARFQMGISVQYKTVRYKNPNVPWEYSVVNDLPIRLVWYYAWGGLTCSKSVANWTWVEIVAFHHLRVRRFEYVSCSELVLKTAKLSYWATAFWTHLLYNLLAFMFIYGHLVLQPYKTKKYVENFQFYIMFTIILDSSFLL